MDLLLATSLLLAVLKIAHYSLCLLLCCSTRVL